MAELFRLGRVGDFGGHGDTAALCFRRNRDIHKAVVQIHAGHRGGLFHRQGRNPFGGCTLLGGFLPHLCTAGGLLLPFLTVVIAQIIERKGLLILIAQGDVHREGGAGNALDLLFRFWFVLSLLFFRQLLDYRSRFIGSIISGRIFSQLADHAAQADPKAHKHADDKQDQQQRKGAVNAQGHLQSHSDQPGDHAAGIQGLALQKQIAHHKLQVKIARDGYGKKQIAHGREKDGQQENCRYTKGHRLTPVEGQNKGRSQKGGC